VVKTYNKEETIMVSENVTTKDGHLKTVYAEDDKALAEAVKQAKEDSAPVYPNINHPVAKGHDLVAVDGDVNKVLVDGTGAHNSPNNAVEPFNAETDPSVEVAGMDEPAYKTVPVGDNDREGLREATDAEVSKAKKDSKPANETK
jgi:hypothetical protein